MLGFFNGDITTVGSTLSGPEIIFVSGIKSSTNLANGPIDVNKSPGPASKEIA